MIARKENFPNHASKRLETESERLLWSSNQKAPTRRLKKKTDRRGGKSLDCENDVSSAQGGYTVSRGICF